jgi:hypothetical protein
MHFEAASLQLTCDMWILTTPNPAVIPVYNSIDKERRLVRETLLAEEIGFSSITSTETFVRATWSLDFSV